MNLRKPLVEIDFKGKFRNEKCMCDRSGVVGLCRFNIKWHCLLNDCQRQQFEYEYYTTPKLTLKKCATRRHAIWIECMEYTHCPSIEPCHRLKSKWSATKKTTPKTSLSNANFETSIGSVLISFRFVCIFLIEKINMSLVLQNIRNNSSQRTWVPFQVK